ncbi:hypothetical protein KIPB_007218 [Kipferlia bialata]|uniref:Thioredoxin domain-containing protein n=1 Tax=Kipferlia bialata TaxID=797122 RepID=A0A9K3CZN7_9EUKA|nr:hypothetical protein KIPB_007218 [Kipferlia bialata]|eukprot:g7218.t1
MRLFQLGMSRLVFCLLVLGLVATCSARVIEANGETFHSLINSDEYVFVKFFTDSCRHCRELWRPYRFLSRVLDEEVTLLEYSCTQDSSVCIELGLDGIPTLYLYHNGDMIAEYPHSDRSVDTMEAWVRDRMAEQA